VKLSALSYFCCPDCRAPRLELREKHSSGGDPEIAEGLLACRQCSASFRIQRGIPRFIPDEEYASSFGFQWNKFRKTQLDSNTGLSLSSDRLFSVTQWPRKLEGDLILEAGSGAGRFTEVLLGTGATVFSFDLSSAVDANWTNNGHQPNLHLFQASIYDIPMREGIFDKVISLGVLQHTPDPWRSFQSLVRFLKPGGEITVDIYARRLSALISWKYMLRPLTTRMPKDRLLRWVESAVDTLLPTAVLLQRIGGRLGARLLPILQYSHLGLPFEINREWAVLDTFDMYSPTYDIPQTLATVGKWFEDCKLENIRVERGPNGIVGRARKKAA
jgi:SAM-dependent methyltransferase